MCKDMTEYDWLRRELEEIHTNRFHIVGGPRFDVLEHSAVDPEIPLPPSYRLFVGEFGTSTLYREGAYYLLRVSEQPWYPQDIGLRADYICIGGYDSSDALFKRDLLRQGSESPVFELGSDDRVRESVDAFHVWLAYRAGCARNRYSAAEWRQIREGPRRFNDREREIVEARRLIEWRLVGVAEDGDLIFEVVNRSNMRLPFLSIGIRAKESSFQGAIWLPTADVAPGATRRIRHRGYKEFYRPEDTEAFGLPDPQPEDRSRYWEFT